MYRAWIWVAAIAGLACSSEPSLGQSCAAPAAPAYQGPLFDAMAQTDQTLDGEEAIANARAVGVTRMALFARVYRKQDGRSLVEELALKHPDFITFGAPKLFDMRGDLTATYVDDVLTGVDREHFAFIGEILYTHGDKTRGEVTATGERYIDPTGPETARLVAGLSGKRVPIMTHWEVISWDRDWPNFDKLYGKFPDQPFIWPHLGFATAQQSAVVLAVHPNVWATLSKKEKMEMSLRSEDQAGNVGPPVTDACDVLEAEWRDLMIRFRDRLMFATDAHVKHRWKEYAHVVKRWRVILGQLPPAVASAIAHDNAERLYGK
jgi:Amidohydrolase